MASSDSGLFDLAIVGGGLVGSSLACALADSGLRIALLEAAESERAPPGFDQRKLALAERSLATLSRLEVLPGLAVQPVPIRRIHVSRAGDFGRILLDADAFGHTCFGGVVLARDLGHALASRVAALPAITRICPAVVTAYAAAQHAAQLTYRTPDGETTLQTRWVIAADGTQSFLRAAAGIGVETHDYGQTLFVCSVQAERDSDGTAYERFSEHGPVALLPMANGAYGAVCGVAAAQADTVAALADDAYAGYLQDRFGWRVGRLRSVGARSRYPLRRVLARRLVSGPVIVIGNAAQTIHPIGAQGFNLGLRDAIGLAEAVLSHGVGPALGAGYAASRTHDRERTLAFSDGLARITANPGLPLHLLRSLGLALLGSAPGLVSGLVGGAMGYRDETTETT